MGAAVVNDDRSRAPASRTDSTAAAGSGRPVITIHVHDPLGSTRSGTGGDSRTAGAAVQCAATAHT
jgi:hypothetical protein